jgi:hypothetical protein
MRLSFLGTAALALVLASSAAYAQRPIQNRQVQPQTVQRAADYHPATPIVVRSQAGEALRVTTYSQRPAERGRLADQYKNIYVNRQRQSVANRRTLSTATPRAIVQRYPEGQFVRRNGMMYRVMPGRSISAF